MIKVIDVHIHVIPPKFLNEDAKKVFMRHPNFDTDLYLEVTKNPDALIKILDDSNVDKVVLISYPAKKVMGYGMDHVEYIGKYAQHYPDRLIPFAGVDPSPRNGDPTKELDVLFSKYEYRGIKIHPVHQLIKPNSYREEEGNNKRLEAIYQYAEDNNIPVTIHTGTSIFPKARIKYGNPIYLDDIAVDFPKLRIIMAHGGRPFWTATAFFLLRRHKNIYLDISGIPPKRILTYFPRLELVVDKVMFGTDWPESGVADGFKRNIDQFMQINISSDAKEKILSRNAEAFFK